MLRSIVAAALLTLMLAPVVAQQVTGVTGSEAAGTGKFMVSAPASYGLATLMWMKVDGVLVENIPEEGIPLEGTNGTIVVPLPGIKKGATIEVAVTFDLAGGSGGLSTTGSGTCGQ